MARCMILLFSLFTTYCLSLRYIPVVSDPTILNRSQFAYQQVDWAALNTKYKYIAAFGCQQCQNLTDTVEFHTMTVQPFALKSDYSVPVLYFNLYARIGLQNSAIPGAVEGCGSAVSYANPSTVTVFITGGYDANTSSVTPYLYVMVLDKTNTTNISSSMIPAVNLTSRSGSMPYSLDQSQVSSSLYFFGGISANQQYSSNTLTLLYSSGDTPLTLATTTFKGTSPSARNNYASAITSSNIVIYFGGQNGNAYFNDTYELTLETGSWRLVPVNLDPVYGSPSPRAGAALSTLSTTPSVMYLYGGTDGVNYFGDVWALSFVQSTVPPYLITYNWTRLDNPLNPGQEFPGRAFHRGGDTIDSTSTVLFFYGGVNVNGTTPGPIAFDVNAGCYPCPVFFQQCVLQFNGQCIQVPCTTSYEECVQFIPCSGANKIPCGVNCATLTTTGITGCLPRPVYAPCVNDTVQCWNSLCAPTLEQCTAYPACLVGTYRCADYSCATDPSQCPDPKECSSGVLCPDQSCQPTIQNCTILLGCNSSLPYQCPDGSCKPSSVDCDPVYNCSGQDSVACYTNCTTNISFCAIPYWARTVVPDSVSMSIPSNQSLNLWFQGDFPPYNPNPVVFVQAANYDPVNPAIFSAQVSRVYWTDVEVVGPEPTWTSAFDPSFVTSVVSNIQTTGVATNLNTLSVALLIRHQLQRNDSVDENVIETLCLAIAAPWYWDPKDLTTDSGLANVPYIAKYRQAMAASPTGVLNQTDFGQPPTRWLCLNQGSETTGNEWPRWLDPNSNPYVAATYPDLWHGVVLLADLNGPVAIVRHHQVLPVVSNPTPAAPNYIAHYAVLAAVSLLLLVLLIVVGIKAFSRPR